MKKILLTGCAGFIGSNFVKSIATKEKDYQFVILDALTYAGHYPTIQNDVEGNDHLSFVQMDIRDKDKIQKLFDDEKFDGVIHFAAESHVDNSIKNPNIFVETNVLGTLNLLNSSISLGKVDFKFVHVSTDEVYGTLSEEDPAFTELNPIEPNSPYSASKASSDLLVRSYYETYKLNTVITRCSNNYGPYQFPEKLIPVMISNALEDKALPVYGDGRNIRDWIYVDDHNRGVWATFLKGKAGEAYNFGGNAEKRNLEVVKTLLSILNKPESLITFVEDRKGHDWRYAMDYSKAKTELGFEPQVTFEEGMKKTVDWYLENTAWCKEVKKG
ncbi:MAG: dTDP-glucose 4,6-dehydratase [Deltaproteobacteria bacterium]|nr:MAG: dTDP-glucose 4,6-dehydratase [Deltaproteobacteria bacterium]